MSCIEKKNHEKKKLKKKIKCAKKGTNIEKSELKQNYTKCKNWTCMII